MSETALLPKLKNSSSFLAAELADVVSDKEAINLLVGHFSDYASLFRSGASFVRSLPPNREICVLLDFDVIYAYLHPETMKPDQSLLARWFFEESRLKYAIPSGAFKELLAHVSGTFGLPPQPIPRSEYENPRVAVGARLGITSEDMFDPNVVAAVESMTDDRVMRLDRLLRILDDEKRFCSIIRTYDSQVHDAAAELVRAEREDAHERFTEIWKSERNALPHDKKDLRDGENLAIALNTELAEKSNQHFVLMTMTRPVLRAARTLFLNRASRGSWFAISPEQLVPAARLGLGESKRLHDVRVKLSNLKDTIESLIGRYNEFLDEINAHATPSKSRINELAKLTNETLLGLDSQGMSRIESVRRPINSARLAAADYMQISDVRRIRDSHPRFTSYLRLLEKIRTQLHKLSGVDYCIQLCESPDADQLKIFSIGDLSDEGRFAEFLRIEVFKNSGGLHLWTAQWELDVNERHLFEAISELSLEIHGVSNTAKGASEPLIEIDPSIHSAIWESGIVVSNGYASFGISLEHALGEDQWTLLSLAKLKVLVLEGTNEQHLELRTFLNFEETLKCSSGIGTLIQEKARSIPVFSHRDHIVDIRVDLPEVDLVFEILPPDGSYRQRFTMMSSQPLYTAVAHFYDWLGIRLAVKSELEKQVQAILEPYFGKV